MMTNRTFGVEIECIGITASSACEAIRAVGLPCEVEGYNHNTRNHWKIVPDGSVRDNNGNSGIEVVSPILRGEGGMLALKRVADALNTAGATANKTCGLHVHVGASDLNIDEIKMIVKRYAEHESVIDSFMPVSRRGDNNFHLKGMGYWMHTYATALAGCTNTAAILNRSWDRYFKVNLAAYVRQNTIEFRHHSGTVSSTKIENWVLFVLNFVEVSRQLVATATPAVARPRRGRPAGRTNVREKGLFKIVNALRNDQLYGGLDGLTPTRIAEISGYAEASIPACMSEIRRKWRITVRKSRIWNTYSLELISLSSARFEEIRAQVQSGQPVTGGRRPAATMPTVPAGDTALRGLSAGVVSYFEARAIVASGVGQGRLRVDDPPE